MRCQIPSHHSDLQRTERQNPTQGSECLYILMNSKTSRNCRFMSAAGEKPGGQQYILAGAASPSGRRRTSYQVLNRQGEKRKESWETSLLFATLLKQRIWKKTKRHYSWFWKGFLKTNRTIVYFACFAVLQRLSPSIYTTRVSAASVLRPALHSGCVLSAAQCRTAGVVRTARSRYI